MMLVLLGAGAGTGLAIALLGAGAPSELHFSASVLSPLSKARSRLGPYHIAALAVGVVALVATRWPMALPLGTAATLGMKGLRKGDSRSAVENLEAIATWSEMLRDTLAGASGLSQALIATAAIAPAPIRPAVSSLAGRLTAGVPLEDALRALADEIADPASDMVVAALLMASRERAQKLGDLLGALALSVREEVSMRLRIEASRASSRTAIRMITGFSLALFLLMALFARSYLSPYSTALGQLVLGFIGLLFALGLWMMATMVRPKSLPRLVLTRSRE